MKKTTRAKILIFLCAVVFSAATVGKGLKVEPFYTGFYVFAWWPFILASESMLVLMEGQSMLWDKPRRFLGLLPVSILIWLVFEAYNFRLMNWHYLNAPGLAAVRWAGYAAAYATVLPAILVTARLLERMGLWKSHGIKPLRNASRLYAPFVCTGVVFLILPLTEPRFFFPLVWGGFIFLLEPLVHRLGGVSLLADWEEGSLRRFYLLLAAGLVCGLLWEFWNFQSGAKWYYTVPYVGFWKVFEMPVLGFLGFPPFAVECYVMANTVAVLRKRVNRLSGAGRWLLIAALWLAAAGFYLLVCAGIEKFTLVTTTGWPG